MIARPELWHRDLAATFDAAASPRLPLDEWAAKYRRVVGGPAAGTMEPGERADVRLSRCARSRIGGWRR